MSDKNRVLEIKTTMNDLTNKKSRLEGQFDAVKKTMSEKYNITDIDVLISERDKLREKRDQLQAEIDTLLNAAEELLNDAQ